MGLCRGPVDEIVEIRVDDKQVWAGRPDEANVSKRVYTSKRNLFGGDGIGGEGGIDGYIEFAMGEPDQVPTQSVLNLVKGIVPGFRGVVTMFYSGWVSAFNAYPKKWSTRVRRATKGWFEGVAWYPEKAKIILRNDNANVTVRLNDGAAGMFGQIGAMPQYTVDVPAITENLKQIHAMNPAHILIESATDPDWGADIDHDIIDLDLYKSIADTLAEEGFGLCIRFNRQVNINTFRQEVLDHIGAAEFLNTELGLLQMKLIRNDYEPDELPLFTYDNGILRVQDDDSTSNDSAINYLTVNYRDPVTNKVSDVTYQNLASIQTHGVIAETRDYLGLPMFELAARVAQRDLAMTASGLKRLIIRFNRIGGQLTPASCFRISLPDRDINNMISLKVIRLLHPSVQWVQTFADERCKRGGVVYQASNFLYIGSHETEFYELDGMFYHPIALNRKKGGKKGEHLKQNIARAQKHKYKQFRYIRFLNKKAKKRLNTKLFNIQPYPKLDH